MTLVPLAYLVVFSTRRRNQSLDATPEWRFLRACLHRSHGIASTLPALASHRRISSRRSSVASELTLAEESERKRSKLGDTNGLVRPAVFLGSFERREVPLPLRPPFFDSPAAAATGMSTRPPYGLPPENSKLLLLPSLASAPPRGFFPRSDFQGNPRAQLLSYIQATPAFTVSSPRSPQGSPSPQAACSQGSVPFSVESRQPFRQGPRSRSLLPAPQGCLLDPKCCRCG